MLLLLPPPTEQVDTLIPKHWEAVQQAVGMAGRSLEESMTRLAADPPCMPAVGFIIKNLVNLDERDEFIQSGTSAASASAAMMLINFDRVRRVGMVVDIVRKSQRVSRTFDTCPALHRFSAL